VFETEEDDVSALDCVQDADLRFGSYSRLAASDQFRFRSQAGG
jgi:hypothetical protein